MSASVAVLRSVERGVGLVGRSRWARCNCTMLSSLTTTMNELVALRFWALTASGLESVTTVVNVLVLGPWASVGVQVIMPLAEMLALVTAPATEVTDKV